MQLPFAVADPAAAAALLASEWSEAAAALLVSEWSAPLVSEWSEAAGRKDQCEQFAVPAQLLQQAASLGLVVYADGAGQLNLVLPNQFLPALQLFWLAAGTSVSTSTSTSTSTPLAQPSPAPRNPGGGAS